MDKRNIKPFRGLRYNSRKADVASCVAPPYDVFNYGDTTDMKLRKNPHNIVHIQKPEGEKDSMYANAAIALEGMLRDEILQSEPEPAFYALKQSWDGISRTGIIAAVRLDSSMKRIRPHEKTKSGPIEDRLKLTRATGLNIGSIFTVFSDDCGFSVKLAGTLDSLLPEYSFEFPENVQNELYIIKDPGLMEEIDRKTLYIADGHHRYRTMLDYRREMSEDSDESPYGYTMIYILPDTQAKIYAYHRLIKRSPSLEGIDLIEELSKKFSVKKSGREAVEPDGRLIGIYCKGSYYTLDPGEEAAAPSVALQEKILEPLLGIDYGDLKDSEKIRYIPANAGRGELLKEISEEDIYAAFFLTPMTVEQLKRISDEGSTLPPKSTFFYPKIPSGVVLRKTGDI